MPRIIITSLLITILYSCSYKMVSEDDFVGTWELNGRSMSDGVRVLIERDKEGKLKGRVVEKNDNKYVKMFVDSSDIWISKIKRSSNFQFRITEKRIARELFSHYKLGTSDEFKVEFINEDVFGLAKNNSDPLKSKILYSRVK